MGRAETQAYFRADSEPSGGAWRFDSGPMRDGQFRRRYAVTAVSPESVAYGRFFDSMGDADRFRDRCEKFGINPADPGEPDADEWEFWG